MKVATKMLSRRTFLQSAASTAALVAGIGRATADETFETLTGRVARVQLAPDGYPQTEIWGYDGMSPGPTLRVPQGARLQRRFVNGLPQPSSVHWHGIRIENAMDGVSGLTQDAVAPGDTFDYNFTVPDAGTYWYHAHNRSVEQVARGLNGLLIVEEPDPLDIDRDQPLVLDDWLLNPETAQLDPDFAAQFDRSHGGRNGNLLLTNGAYDLTLTAQRHERLRLRLVNVANARIFVLGLEGMEGWTVALDGMPLEIPEPIEGPILLGPGQRADLIVDIVAAVGERAYLTRVDDERGGAQVTFDIRGTASLARRRTPSALPPNRIPDIRLDGSELVATLDMEGGAMGRMRRATYEGEELSFSQLAQRNQFWAFNGVVGMPETPLLDAGLGQTVRMNVINQTSFPHAMHLHGMHFSEVGPEDRLGPLRDTLLIGGGEQRQIAFDADNPGDWLFHCHMLSHAAAGMTTWLRVA